MDLDVNGSCHADDGAGAGIFLRRPGKEKKRIIDDDAVVFYLVPDKLAMDIMGLQPIFRAGQRAYYRESCLGAFERSGP